MFRKCYPNTLETTTSLLDDGTTYVITGDIDLMWLRDSSAQVHQYMMAESVVKDPEIARIVEGLIRRQGIFIQRVLTWKQNLSIDVSLVPLWCLF
jgi:meiotically up-regulated gene 157 (Mug157) protein